MQYGYAYQLNGAQISGFDPEAKAYILAVEAADGASDFTVDDEDGNPVPVPRPISEDVPNVFWA
jgi:hypothetical protein